MILFANLSGESLVNPLLGVGSALTSLRRGGFANDPAFGGAGDQALAELGPHQVFVTLVPSDSATFRLGADFGGVSTVATSDLANGELLYLLDTNVPRPFDQRLEPSGESFGGRTWAQLTSVDVLPGGTGQVRVELSNGGTGHLAADAVRLVREVLPVLRTAELSGNPLDNAAYDYILPGLLGDRPGQDDPATESATEFAPLIDNNAWTSLDGLRFSANQHAPVIQEFATLSAPAGTSSTLINDLNGIGSDADGDALYWSAESDSSSVEVRVVGNALLQVTPQSGFVGSATITLKATIGRPWVALPSDGRQ
jgi:hypothetical protein